MPITDEVGQLEVLPPTPGRPGQLEESECEQRPKGEPSERQVEQEEKGWPQEGEDPSPVKGEAFLAKESFLDVKVRQGEETLGNRGNVACRTPTIGGATVGAIVAITAIFHETILVLGSGVIFGPLASSTTAFGAPVVLNSINHLGVGFTIFGSRPLSRASRRGIASAIATTIGATISTTIGALWIASAIAATWIVVSRSRLWIVGSRSRLWIVVSRRRIVACGSELLVQLSNPSIELFDSVHQSLFRSGSVFASTPFLGCSEIFEVGSGFIQKVTEMDPIGQGGNNRRGLPRGVLDEGVDSSTTAHPVDFEIHHRGIGEDIHNGEQVEAGKELILFQLGKHFLSSVTVGVDIFTFELSQSQLLEILSQLVSSLKGVTLHLSHNHHPQDRATGTEGHLGTERSFQSVIQGVSQPKGRFVQG